ncbi:ribosomal protein L10e/L16, partial [Vararia minispora EC-137]
IRQVLAPKKMPYIKRHKGVLPVPTGGSLKGTTLAFGDYGLRIKGDAVRLSAKLLKTTYENLRRTLKPVKGCKIYMRVFPDIPVCIKGNETRMGKGKGSFEFWATRHVTILPFCKTGRVIFEISGPGLRDELAREALRQAAFRMPVAMEFITRQTPPRLGRLFITPKGPV